MLRLIQKFSLMFFVYQVIYYATLFPAMNYDRIKGPDPLDLSFVLYLNIYMLFIIIGSIWGHEQLEHKSRGYEFLRTLPIRHRDIVASKFLLAFLSVALYVAMHLAWFRIILDRPELRRIARTNLWLTAAVCLALVGFYLLGFLRWGYHRFSRFAVPFWLLLIVAPLPAMILLKERFNFGSRDIIHALQLVNPYPVLAAGLMLFAAAFLLAARWGRPVHA